MSSKVPRPPIAVVALSALFPGSQDETGFWHDILAGRDLIREVPPSHWLVEDYYDPNPEAPDKTYAKRGAFLEPTQFDALGFGVPPSIVPATDTSQLLALIVAQRVLDEAARGQFASMNRERISVILGVTSGQELLASMVSRLQRPVWVKSLREAGVPESKVVEICERIASHYVPWQESTFPGLLGNVVAGRIANRFDLGGTNCVTDAACASAFSALSMAVNELYLGQADLVLTGGVDTLNDIFMQVCFSKTPALSKTGDCRPFSEKADGTLLGEGLAMMALKRLDDAERDGDRVHAVLRGIGSSSDGRAKSVYAPRPEGQARALNRAYEAAGYGPETVELVEAHGTGTTAGDVAEFEGLGLVFDASGRTDRQWCAIGSVKSQIGHTKAAAGAAGLFKAILSVQHGTLPPTLKVEKPNPKLGLERSPFYVNTSTRPWVRGSEHPRRAGVSSFGFGGSNFHVTVEEYRGGSPALRKRVAPAELVVFGADTAAALVAKLREVEVGGPGFLRWLARDSQESCRGTPAARVAILAADEAELQAKLASAADAIAKAPDKAFSSPNGVHYGLGPRDGKLAFLFPGQGSQYVGMGAGLAVAWGEALAAWDLAAELPIDGREKLHDVVFPRPTFGDEAAKADAERLRRTEWAQPAIGAASLAQLRLLTALGLEPDCVAGHSFGEVVALHVAGAFDPATMLRIARRRGELMAQAARTPGAMTAALAPIAEVRSAIDGVEDVVVANHNGPKQVVLSGPTRAIERAEAALQGKGIRTERLQVATAFHSPVVADSVTPFQAYLDEVRFAPTSIPAFANAEAAPYPADPAAARTMLATALARPVRFVEQIEAMFAAGVRTFVEVGPATVLTGLVERILAGKPFRAVSLDAKGKDSAVAFQDGLGRLWAAGCELRFGALWASFQPVADPRKAKKPAVALSICGSNYGKPYPPPEGAKALPPPNPEREPEVVVREVIKEVPVPVAAAPGAVPAATPSAPVPLAVSGTEGASWLAAYQQAQRETMEVHAAFQNTMAQTHLAFLQTVERSFAGINAALGVPVGVQPAMAPLPLAALPAVPAMPAQAPAVAAPVAVVSPESAKPASPPKPAPAHQDGASGREAPATPRAAAAPLDLKALLLAVVSEKTGYPAEMLSLELGLESDLGIDSIKRVEILSAMRARVPDMPEVQPAAMASLRTLGAIVEYLQQRQPAGESAPPPAAAAPSVAPARDLKALLLEVVAEKTGYPAETLSMELGLESDLGIDSIKRVEILSAMRTRVPGLPEVAPAAMASLRTLGAIVGYLEERAAGAPSAANPAPQAHAATQPPAEPDAPASAHRFVVEAVERPAPGLALAGLMSAAKLVVTGGSRPIADAVVSALAARGVSASRAAEVPADADGVLFLGDVGEPCDPERASRVVREAFRAARAVAPRFAERGGAFVTVQDSGGDFGLSGSERAWSAGVAAIAKTAAVEWPTASVRAIDLAVADRDPAQVAEALAAELFEGAAELEVGLARDGRRLTLRPVERPVPAGAGLVLDERSVVVATGGARGVTAACLVALARAARCRFLLLGRTPLDEEPQACRGIEDDGALKRALLEAGRAEGRSLSPAELGAMARRIRSSREVLATLEAIREAGGEARYVAVDVRRREELQGALAEVRSAWGAITALVHGAGVIADKRIAEKTDEQFDSVFDTKVAGLRAVLEATRGDELRAMLFFSSIAARVGNAGQCDYAAANEVLNKVAALEARRRPGCLVRSIGWGPWDGGMVDAGLRAHFAASGTPILPLAAGAAAFVAEAAAGDRAVEVVVAASTRLGPVRIAAPGFDVLVSRTTHPFLADHAIDDTVVLPVVMAVEWFARAARAARPDLELVGCRDVRVLKGVRLEHYFNGGDRFTVACRPAPESPTRLQLELRGADGTLHYTAVAELAEGPVTPAEAPAPPASLERFSRELYGRELFHGPAFQVIQSVDGVSVEGATGTLVGTADRRWSGAWSTDAAALDGGLQLALLWTGHVLGGRSLPTAVESFHAYRFGLAEGLIRCALRGRIVEEHRTVSDIAFIAPDGAVLSELRGVEVHRRPEPSARSRS